MNEIELEKEQKKQEEQLLKIKKNILASSTSIDEIFEAIQFCRGITFSAYTEEQINDIKKKYFINDEIKELFTRIKNLFLNLNDENTKSEKIRFKDSNGKFWDLILKKPDIFEELIRQYNLLVVGYQKQIDTFVSFVFPFEKMKYFEIANEFGDIQNKKTLQNNGDKSIKLLLEPLYLLYLMALVCLKENEEEEEKKLIEQKNTPNLL